VPGLSFVELSSIDKTDMCEQTLFLYRIDDHDGFCAVMLRRYLCRLSVCILRVIWPHFCMHFDFPPSIGQGLVEYSNVCLLFVRCMYASAHISPCSRSLTRKCGKARPMPLAELFQMDLDQSERWSWSRIYWANGGAASKLTRLSRNTRTSHVNNVLVWNQCVPCQCW
jgi:hypothetical protein